MKKIIILLAVVAIAFVSCKEDATKKVKQDNLKRAQAQNKVNREDAPVIEFSKTVHDFGNINEGDNVETVFKFKNIGKSELLITKIKGSCGCTVPSNWPKKPIMPGEEAEFSVKFNSKGKPNTQQKTITLTCNTSTGKEQVKIKAQVTPDPKQVEIRKERAEKRKKQQTERKKEQANKTNILEVAPKK